MQMYPGWSARDNYAQSKEVDFITSKVNITNNIINTLKLPATFRKAGRGENI